METQNKNNNINNDLCGSISIDKINNLKEIGTNAIYDNIDDISININNINNNANNNINNILRKENKENDFLLLNNNNIITNKSINIEKIENSEKKYGDESRNNNSEFPQKICRICYQEDDEEKNPLIQPCLCSGSLKYIHLNCLKQWIGTRNCVRIDNNEYDKDGGKDWYAWEEDNEDGCNLDDEWIDAKNDIVNHALEGTGKAVGLRDE